MNQNESKWIKMNQNDRVCKPTGAPFLTHRSPCPSKRIARKNHLSPSLEPNRSQWSNDLPSFNLCIIRQLPSIPKINVFNMDIEGDIKRFQGFFICFQTENWPIGRSVAQSEVSLSSKISDLNCQNHCLLSVERSFLVYIGLQPEQFNMLNLPAFNL